MRKNGSRLISYQQYRTTDLFLFAVLLVIFDLLSHYTPKLFSGSALFSFALTLPITLLVMMRWGWYSVFFAVGDGLLLSALNNPGLWQSYVSYAAGNAFMMLLLLMTKFMGKERIAGKWYFSALFVFAGWCAENLGITVVQTILGYNFLSSFLINFGMNMTGLLSLAMGLVIILVLRQLDGMFEDQKHYLLRMESARKEKLKLDNFGEEPIDIDEESLSILDKRNDELYK